MGLTNGTEWPKMIWREGFVQIGFWGSEGLCLCWFGFVQKGFRDEMRRTSVRVGFRRRSLLAQSLIVYFASPARARWYDMILVIYASGHAGIHTDSIKHQIHAWYLEPTRKKCFMETHKGQCVIRTLSYWFKQTLGLAYLRLSWRNCDIRYVWRSTSQTFDLKSGYRYVKDVSQSIYQRVTRKIGKLEN